eukprot:3635904-Pleurochrysis_carterae.AAC.1
MLSQAYAKRAKLSQQRMPPHVICLNLSQTPIQHVPRPVCAISPHALVIRSSFGLTSRWRDAVTHVWHSSFSCCNTFSLHELHIMRKLWARSAEPFALHSSADAIRSVSACDRLLARSFVRVGGSESVCVRACAWV